MVFESPQEEDEGGLEAALESIEWWLIRARKKQKKKKVDFVDAPKNVLVIAEKAVEGSLSSIYILSDFYFRFKIQ